MSEIAQLKNLPEISFIDNLTMKEVEEIAKSGYSESVKAATGKTPTLYPASVPAVILKEMTLLAYQILQYVDAGPKQTLLKYSAHENLDNLAGNYGLTRRQAEKATVTIRFTLADAKQPGAVGIPAKTRVCRVELRLFRNACIENPEDHRRAYPEDHEAAGCGNGRKPDPSSTRDGTGRSAELGSDRGC